MQVGQPVLALNSVCVCASSSRMCFNNYNHNVMLQKTARCLRSVLCPSRPLEKASCIVLPFAMCQKNSRLCSSNSSVFWFSLRTALIFGAEDGRGRGREGRSSVLPSSPSLKSTNA